MGIESYSTTPGNNTASPPNGWPEGMAAANVNNCARQNMADLRTWYESAQWINYGHTPTKVDADTFTVSGDQTAIYDVGRRVKFTGSVSGYAIISSSSYSAPNTTVNVSASSWTGTLTAVAVGILSANNNAIPQDQVAVAAQCTGSIHLNASGFNPVTFDSELIDRGSNYDPATGIFTAPAIGMYQVSVGLILQNNRTTSAVLEYARIITSSNIKYYLSGMPNTSTINGGGNPFNLTGGATFPLDLGGTLYIDVLTGAFTAGSGFFNVNANSYLSIVRVAQ